MAQKKKRLSISEQLKELRDMREASKRRQAGERVTSDQVTSVRKRAEAEAKSNARKQSEGGGMGKPKPKPKPTTPAAKPKPKPKPAPASAKPKPKPKPTSGTQGSSMPSNPPGMRQTRGKDLREKDPQSGLYINQSPSPKKPKPPKKGDVKREGGQWKRWNGTKWVVTRSPY